MDYSVIIPTYNRLSVLNRAIESAYAQTLPPKEVIIVDDASTDNTVEWLRSSYPQIVLLEHQANKGVSAARNTAINYCQNSSTTNSVTANTSDWIAFLDSDDEWLPEKMQKQSQELEATSYKICHTEEIWIRNGVRVNAPKRYAKKSGDIYSDCLEMCAMSPSTVVLHKSLFTEFDTFDEDIVVCEDYDLWLRMCSKYPVALIDTPMIKKYGGHDDQLSTRYFGVDQYRIMALEKLLKFDLSTERLMELHNALFTKLRILKVGAEKHQNQELLAFCESRQTLFMELSDLVTDV